MAEIFTWVVDWEVRRRFDRIHAFGIPLSLWTQLHCYVFIEPHEKLNNNTVGDYHEFNVYYHYYY